MRGETRLTRRWTMRLTRRYMVIEVGLVVCRLIEGVAEMVGWGG